MGWSHAGNTRQKYQHYYSDDGIDAMLVIDGLVAPNSKNNGKARNLLKPRVCPNCNEGNKPESKYCAKCKFVLTFDVFNEAIEGREKAAKEAQETKKILEATAKELAQLRFRQEEAVKRQQLEIAQIRGQMAENNKNTQQNLSSQLYVGFRINAQ